jgi:hypothetical protein
MTIYEFFDELVDQAGDLRYSKEGLDAIYDVLSLIQKSSLADIQVLREDYPKKPITTPNAPPHGTN